MFGFVQVDLDISYFSKIFWLKANFHLTELLIALLFYIFLTFSIFLFLSFKNRPCNHVKFLIDMNIQIRKREIVVTHRQKDS